MTQRRIVESPGRRAARATPLRRVAHPVLVYAIIEIAERRGARGRGHRPVQDIIDRDQPVEGLNTTCNRR
jgi:hypothetical protein